jgi:hypothetical protein
MVFGRINDFYAIISALSLSLSKALSDGGVSVVLLCRLLY